MYRRIEFAARSRKCIFWFEPRAAVLQPNPRSFPLPRHVSVMDHSLCPKNSRGRHIRYQVQWLSGEAVKVDPFDDRIHDNTDMDWVIHAICSSISWPRRYLSFYVGKRQFTYIHRIADRQRVLLVDLRHACLTAGISNPADNLIINVVARPPPRILSPGVCICDFPGHGCCLTGRTDEWKDECANCAFDCRSCGKCCVCRSGDCDHSCCLSPM